MTWTEETNMAMKQLPIMIKHTLWASSRSFMSREDNLPWSRLVFMWLSTVFSESKISIWHLYIWSLQREAAQLQQKLLCLGFSLTPKKVSVTVCFSGAAYKQKSSRDKVQFPLNSSETSATFTEQIHKRTLASCFSRASRK